jgi:hypothetical protein
LLTDHRTRPAVELDETTAGVLLQNFTPLDTGVQADLDEGVVRGHVGDLVQRLALTAEIVAPGRGAGRVLSALGDAAPGTDVLGELDALIEFGRHRADLTADEQEKADRSELRQEILHFDRIMDLEALRDGRRVLKRRRDVAHTAGPVAAAERLFVLAIERQIIRRERSGQYYDLSSTPQRYLAAAGGGVTLSRTVTPYVHAVALGEQDGEAGAALERLERYALYHPLPVVFALLRYEAFLDERPLPPLAAVSLGRDASGGIVAEILSTGAFSWTVLTRDGYAQRVVDRGAIAPDADAADVSFGHATVTVPDEAWLLLTSGDAFTAVGDLGAVLNERGRNGRIDLRANLARFVAGPVLTVKGQSLPAAPSTEDADAEERAEIGAYAATLVPEGGSLHLSLECGHVHADREIGPAQLRGLRMGAALVDRLREQPGAVTVDVTPMVDDDHVLNRFSFRSYRDLYASHGLGVDDLILESSPLPRAVAHDILRRAVAGDGGRYKLATIGGNLYLETADMRLELVEDLNGEMRNGCVLFEVGLVMYRAARAALTDVFWEKVGGGRHDLHGAMSDGYDSLRDPLDREELRLKYETLYRDPWPTVLETVDDTPFIDAYLRTLAEREQAGTRSVVLNVLEDYYRPQQIKVARLAQLLDIPLPMNAVFFSPYGTGLDAWSADAVGQGGADRD